MSELNLAQRMLAVAKDVSHIAKDVSVKHAGANYKGLSHDGVVAAVRDAMITHGVLALPSVIATNHGEAETKSGNVQQMIDVTVETTFINADDMSQTLSVTTVGTGIDSQDKAPGKAMSYAKKYGLLYAFLLITGENDEARPVDNGEGFSRRQQPTQQAARPRPAPATEDQKAQVRDLASRLEDAKKRTDTIEWLDSKSCNASSIEKVIANLESELVPQTS